MDLFPYKRTPDNPIFKDYVNAEIAASAFWDITPVESNHRPIAVYAPFDSIQIQNNSDYNIEVIMNGSSNKKFKVMAGCGALMTGQNFETIRITNQNASNVIAASELDIQIGVGMSSQLAAA